MSMTNAWLLVLAQIGSVFFLITVVLSVLEIIGELRWWARGSLTRVVVLVVSGLFSLWVGISLWGYWA